MSTWGRGRTDGLLLFRQTLLPTELPRYQWSVGESNPSFRLERPVSSPIDERTVRVWPGRDSNPQLPRFEQGRSASCLPSHEVSPEFGEKDSNLHARVQSPRAYR